MNYNRGTVKEHLQRQALVFIGCPNDFGIMAEQVKQCPCLHTGLCEKDYRNRCWSQALELILVPSKEEPPAETEGK